MKLEGRNIAPMIYFQFLIFGIKPNHVYSQPTQNHNLKTCIMHLQPLEARLNKITSYNNMKPDPKKMQWWEYNSYQLFLTHMECQGVQIRRLFFLIWANVGFSKTKNLTWFLIVSKHSFMIIEVVLCVIPYKSPHIIKILLLPNHANVKATLVCMRILFLIFVSFFNFKTRSKIVHKYSNVRRFTRIRFLNILSTNELRRLYSIYQPILSYSHKDLGVFIQPPSRVKQPPTSFWHFIHI